MKRQISLALTFVCILAACADSTWRNDPVIKAVSNTCSSQSGMDYKCVEQAAVAALNPEICRLVGISIDDMCLQAVYEAADNPIICDRIYLQGVVPNCRAYYAQHTPAVSTRSATATVMATQTPTPTPAPWMSLPETNETILTIRNDQPYSGRVGEPKPDWVGWGSQAFSLAPNGDIWILDNAAQPPRLVHLAPPYVTPQLISLDDLVAGATDVEAASDAIWMLGIASQPPRVLKLSTDGKLLQSYDLPRGLWPENGLSGIALAQDGSLLIELAGGTGLYQLFDPDGQVAPQKLEGYTFGGRLFRVVTATLSKQATIYAGDDTIMVNSPLPIGALRVLGVAPDGSFYAEMYVMPEALGSNGVRVVLRYSPEGQLLGVAYTQPTDYYAEQDILVGPDGLVYELVSNPDHSVQVVRLGFKTGESALVVPTVPPTGMPTLLIPLLPTWTVTPAGANDLDMAQHTLLTFFTLLHDGRYAEAVPLYGGDYETMRIQNPDVPANDYAALWQSTCTHQTPCLLVSKIVEGKSVAQNVFEFVVEFVWLDGTLFKLGPCCGATEAEMPPVWQFPYTVKKVDGLFKVMEGPVYIP